MSFIDTIIQADQELLVYLNNFGNTNWDSFWLYITKASHWIPMFLIWIFLLIKNFGWKQGLFFFFFMAAVGGLSDQLVNLIKYSFERPRPCWQEGVMEQIRILKCTHSFSFVSGHATTSMALTSFFFLLNKDKMKWAAIFYIWPLLFAYSRIYMGKHYPADITCGYLLGITEAILYLKLAKYIAQKLKIGAK